MTADGSLPGAPATRRARARAAVRGAWAQIRHRPLRAATVGLAVLLSTACVIAILILDGNTILTRQWFAASVWGDPDLVVTFPTTTLEDARRIVGEARGGDDVDAALGVLIVEGPAAVPGLPVYVVEGDHESFKFLSVREGERTLRDGAVLGRTAAPGRVPRRIGGALIRVVSRADHRYFGGNRGADGLCLPASTPGLPPGLTVRPVLWLRTDAPGVVRERFDGRAMVQDAPHRSLWMSTEDSAMRAAVKIASLLTLVLAAFVLAHVTRVGLLERSREMAVHRALGRPRSAILGLGLLETGMVAAPAAVLAVPCGAGLAHALGRLGISTLGHYKVWFMDFPVGPVALAILAGIVIPMLGAWFSLRAILRIDAAATLGPVFQARPPLRAGSRIPDWIAGGAAILVGVLLASLLARVESPRVESILLQAAGLVAAAVVLVVILPPVVAPATAVLGIVMGRVFGVMGRLAARTGEGGGRALRPAIVGVTGVFVIVLTLENLVQSMEEEIIRWGRAALRGRAYITLHRGIEESELDRVRRARPGLVIVPVVGEWRRPVAIRAMDLAPLLETDRLSDAEADVVRAVQDGEGFIASRAFAIQYGLAVGDRPVLGTTAGSRALPIVAVSDRFGANPTDRAYLIAGAGFAETNLGLSPGARARRLLVWTRDGRDPDRDLMRGLRADLGPIGRASSTGGHHLAKRLEKTGRDFRIFDAIWAILALLATVGTVGTIGLRALERRRELALMRVLGTTRRQFRTYFMAQGFAIGLTGGLLALLAALPFTAAAVAGLREVSGMDVRFVYSGVSAATCLIFATGLGTLAGALAHVRARRLDWAGALKYE